MENVFDWLQNWYKSQCDGDWEHEYGIDIKTVDNPGWYITINLTGTECENCTFLPVKFNKDETNWYFCLQRNKNFEASGGACNLIEILEIFRHWVENCQRLSKDTKLENQHRVINERNEGI